MPLSIVRGFTIIRMDLYHPAGFLLNQTCSGGFMQLRYVRRWGFPRPSAWLGALLMAVVCRPCAAELRVGAAVIDITPEQFPVYINGGMTARRGEPRDIKARAIVLDDGRAQIAVVVADSCMLPKELIDGAKALAAERTRIPVDRMTIAATHTHSAPSAMGALGTPADETYVPLLRLRLADVIVEAQSRLQPARMGFTSVSADAFTAVRRWILRPDSMQLDPFGDRTVRATMHAARGNLAHVTGESGPEDPELAVIAFQTPAGHPLALLANFSMHYFGGGGAADYFGAYCATLEQHFRGQSEAVHPPVAIMSHGCSGDIWRTDYRTGDTIEPVERFVAGLAARTIEAVDAIGDYSDADLSMAELRVPLRYRVPDAARLAWARQVAETLSGKLPQTQPEIYALEQLFLHEKQSTEVVVQALRIGNVAIATTPNETYALTGLKLKRQSPAAHTMVIELANGGDGYIPPPEQHRLGGYNTWAARSAGLEVAAEPILVEADLSLLEKVCGKPRRPLAPPDTAMSRVIRAHKPLCYYPLDDMTGPVARDAGGQSHDGIFEDGVVFYLEGPVGPRLVEDSVINRAAHFAGGRLTSRVPLTAGDYTVSLWCWNGLVSEARPLSGWLFSHDWPHGTSPAGVHLGVVADGPDGGRLAVQLGSNRHLGQSTIERWRWHHVGFVRAGDNWYAYVDGNVEASGQGAGGHGRGDVISFGGRSDGADSWEGRLDEIAVFDRALSHAEIAELAARSDP